MTTLPTRQQIEDAQPLTFDDRPRKKNRAVAVQLCYHGALVTFTFNAADNVPVTEIEQSVDTLLKREGWSGAPQPAANSTGSGKGRGTWVEAEYNGAGERCCPVHHKKLSQGKYGEYCSGKGGDVVNDNGYCALKFKE